MSNASVKRGRLQMLLVVAVFAAPMLAAYIAAFHWRPTRTSNYGELLAPEPLPAIAATALPSGQTFDWSRLRGKWVLLQFEDAGCAEECRNRLYVMRQTRLAQGRNMERIERVFLTTSAQDLEADLMRAYEGTHFLRANAPGALHSSARSVGSAQRLYLVDPQGNVMMRFPPRPDAARMIKDIGKLLKASYVG